jgi:hypothetical protein
MNNKRIYDEIIERAKSRGLNKKLLDGYFERHHIVPKCLNGTNDKDNLVLLTAREHYLCHWLLVKIHKNCYKLWTAYFFLTKKNKITSKQYEKAKHNHQIHASLIHKGKIMSDESKLKMKLAKENYVPWNLGKHHSNDMKRKLSEMFKGKARSSKKCVIDDISFNSILDASKYVEEKYGFKYKAFKRKLKMNFNNWKLNA